MTDTEGIAGKSTCKALAHNGRPPTMQGCWGITEIRLFRGEVGSLTGLFDMTTDSIRFFSGFFFRTQNGNILVGSIDNLFYYEVYICLPIGWLSLDSPMLWEAKSAGGWVEGFSPREAWINHSAPHQRASFWCQCFCALDNVEKNGQHGIKED